MRYIETHGLDDMLRIVVNVFGFDLRRKKFASLHKCTNFFGGLCDLPFRIVRIFFDEFSICQIRYIVDDIIDNLRDDMHRTAVNIDQDKSTHALKFMD